MKKSVIYTAAGILLGMAIGGGVAFASGGPSIQGIYGYLAGNPVYKVDLEASSGLFVGGCPNGQTLTSMPMANGGHVLHCK